MFDPVGVLFPMHASLQSWKTCNVICKCAVNIQETMVTTVSPNTTLVTKYETKI